MKKKFEKKLNVSKSTIVNLDKNEMYRIKGASIVIYCTESCSLVYYCCFPTNKCVNLENNIGG
jgi:hypothetical protein